MKARIIWAVGALAVAIALGWLWVGRDALGASCFIEVSGVPIEVRQRPFSGDQVWRVVRDGSSGADTWFGSPRETIVVPVLRLLSWERERDVFGDFRLGAYNPGHFTLNYALVRLLHRDGSYARYEMSGRIRPLTYGTLSVSSSHLRPDVETSEWEVLEVRTRVQPPENACR